MSEDVQHHYQPRNPREKTLLANKHGCRRTSFADWQAPGYVRVALAVVCLPRRLDEQFHALFASFSFAGGKLDIRCFEAVVVLKGRFVGSLNASQREYER